MLISTSASAQWQSLGENEIEKAYVDATDIQKSRHDTVKMWSMFDLISPRNIGDMRYLSMKIQREYACREKKTRIISRSAYAEHMGIGNMIYSSNTHDKWAAIQPDSVEEALWKIACEINPK